MQEALSTVFLDRASLDQGDLDLSALEGAAGVVDQDRRSRAAVKQSGHRRSDGGRVG